MELPEGAEREEAGRVLTLSAACRKGLPALLRAWKIGARVADVGFEWDTATDVIA